MQAFVEKMSSSQKVWYAKLLVRTILADGAIIPTEIKYLKDVIALIDAPESRAAIVKLIDSKQSPPLEQPESFSKDSLVLIFTQLIKSCISDMDFAKEEKILLIKVSYLFDFTPEFTQKLMEWGEEGLVVKQKQQQLTSKRINDQELLVPVTKLHIKQKLWYIDVIATAMMTENVGRIRKIRFVKAMLASTEKGEEKELIKKHALQKHRPLLRRPPGIPDEVLILIFIELIIVLTLKGDLSYQGQEQITALTDICKLPTMSYSNLTDWCHRGLVWKQTKKKLISEVEVNLSPKDEVDINEGRLEAHINNNSLLTREVSCFICRGSETFQKHSLKPTSQSTHNNIFGIPKYIKAREGFNFIDFNLVGISVCPNCFFASNKDHLFAKNKKDILPEELSHHLFREKWEKNIIPRKEYLAKELRKIGEVRPLIKKVVKVYQLAILSAEQASEFSLNEVQKQRALELRLQLAEVFMNNNLIQQAEEELIEVQQISEYLIENGKDEPSIFNSIKMLLLISLYQDNENKVQTYFDRFKSYKKETAPLLKLDLRKKFKKLDKEIEMISNSQKSYSKKALKGFHLAP